MASVPTQRGYREDNASALSLESLSAALSALSLTVTEAVSGFAKRLNRRDNFEGGEKMDVKFTSPNSGNATVRFHYEQASTPHHFQCTNVARSDNSALTSAWSVTFKLVASSTVEATFQGLPSSTTFNANFIYE